MQPPRASKIAAGPQEADPVTVEATGYGLPCRSSINANTAAITFSSSAILRMMAVEGSPRWRAASSIKACCAPLRRSSNDRTLAEALWEHGREVESPKRSRTSRRSGDILLTRQGHHEQVSGPQP